MEIELPSAGIKLMIIAQLTVLSLSSPVSRNEIDFAARNIPQK